MAAPAIRRRYTPDEYLALERASELKSELIDGQIVAMTGASRAHTRINTNLATILDGQLLDRPCDVFMSDMRVKVSVGGLYTYPDAVVVCGEAQYEDEQVDTLLNPTLIVEILSPSTEAYDRGAKFGYYRELPSLREYLLIAQDKVLIERFVRENDHWVFTADRDLSTVVRLPSIDCDLPIAGVYRRVQLPEPDDPASEQPKAVGRKVRAESRKPKAKRHHAPYQPDPPAHE